MTEAASSALLGSPVDVASAPASSSFSASASASSSSSSSVASSSSSASSSSISSASVPPPPPAGFREGAPLDLPLSTLVMPPASFARSSAANMSLWPKLRCSRSAIARKMRWNSLTRAACKKLTMRDLISSLAPSVHSDSMLLKPPFAQNSSARLITAFDSCSLWLSGWFDALSSSSCRPRTGLRSAAAPPMADLFRSSDQTCTRGLGLVQTSFALSKLQVIHDVTRQHMHRCTTSFP